MIARATIALQARPDVPADKATRAEVAESWAANDAAYVILTEGRDPPSQRGASNA